MTDLPSDMPSHLPELSPGDRKLLDALVECGFEPDALSLDEEQRRRADAILGLLGLLDDYLKSGALSTP